jgi:7-keto-8-aminopelargonate synthetase-like enzyme
LLKKSNVKSIDSASALPPGNIDPSKQDFPAMPPESPASAEPPQVDAWTMEGPPGAETVLNGRRYLYFAGTGYLGLQGHPALVEAAKAAIDCYGVHTATTRSGFGTSPPVREVERRAAQFFGSEAALYLVSGYAGNFGIAAALAPEVDVVLVDELAHDCLRESIRWLDHLQRPAITFRHRDVNHVRALLEAEFSPCQRPLLMTDGIFPVSGNLAPVSDYLSVLSQFPGALLLVDDAHAVGAVGEHGRGTLELAGVPAGRINRDLAEPINDSTDSPRVFLSATLSKAFGGHGGIIPGSTAFLDRVRQSSGWFRGASAPAAAVAAATAKGLEIVQGDPPLRRRLADNVATLRHGLRALGLDVELSPSPVVGLRLDSAERMQHVQQRLVSAGIVVAYARDYAGAGPAGMLRIAVFATHTRPMIERLVDCLGQALQASGPG